MLMDALRLLRGGRLEEGLALYLEVLAGDARRVPVGIHAGMLADFGQDDAASAILEAGLRRGCDLGVKTALPGRTPDEVAREYEGLFDRGLVNAWMVSRYLLALDHLGRRAELRELLDPAQRVRTRKLDVSVSVDREVLLSAAVRESVLAHEHDAVFEAKSQSVRQMHNLPNVHGLPDPAFRSLAVAVRGEVERLIAEWAPGGHPVTRWCPSRFSLSMWALTSRGAGFNARHVHHVGWYTGVFYATGVEGAGGELRIGRPSEVDADSPDWPDLTIRPEPGLLVLMPSYFTHWTEPLGQPGLRISVPFDVLGEGSAGGGPR